MTDQPRTAIHIIPTPSQVVPTSQGCVLGPGAQVLASPAVTRLAEELLSPSTGRADDMAAEAATLRFSLIDEPELGDEGYRLRINGQNVSIHAQTEQGHVWALQTLRQLASCTAVPAGSAPRTLPGVAVTDVPRLPWRGVLVDVARWYQPLSFLLGMVDRLAMHKFNVLHLHLTDDQGWRFEVSRYPRLAEIGGFRAESSSGHLDEGRFDGTRHGGYYTQKELRILVSYAAARGVQVMPELDLPGHMQAAVSAYPGLGNRPDVQLKVRAAWGISPHILNTRDTTLDFMRHVLDELVDVFPFDYIHLGGDEIPLDEWRSSTEARQRVNDEGLNGAAALASWWITTMGRHLQEHGRKFAAWDDQLEVGLPREALIFAWQSAARVGYALARGHEVVAVPEQFVYLDRAETDSPREPTAIDGPLPLSQVYDYEPVPAGAEGRVLGSQGMLWAEYLPRPSLVDWRAFPRLTAIAERCWSGGGRKREYMAALPHHLLRLTSMGVRYNTLAATSGERKSV
ncbi:beta-N-acetylhexosaminidase [Amycolatopsis sp. NPDC051102]|uniref:beta-N-acetylhexosaminidase n=1 Tax=Amycolatopsis sp. NPDC051102 TaxID=3155163 RepID=UPI003428FFB7